MPSAAQRSQFRVADEAAKVHALAVSRAGESAPEPVADDRNKVAPGDPTLLIVEDDPHYAKIMVDPPSVLPPACAAIGNRAARAARSCGTPVLSPPF